VVLVAGSSGEDFGVLKFGVTVMAESVMCHHPLVRLSKPDVTVVFFHCGLSGWSVCPI